MSSTRSLVTNYHVMGRARPGDRAQVDTYLNMLSRLQTRKGGKKKRTKTKKRGRKRRTRRRKYTRRRITNMVRQTTNHLGINKGKSKGCFTICASSTMK